MELPWRRSSWLLQETQMFTEYVVGSAGHRLRLFLCIQNAL